MSAGVPFLSPHKIGPYEHQLLLVPRSSLSDKRYRFDINYVRRVGMLDEALEPTALADYLVRYLLVLLHERSGLNDTCDEEAFTHSLAAGLVDLARSSPAFWEEVQHVLEEAFAPGSGWAACASTSCPPLHLPVPAEVRYKRTSCKIYLDHKTCSANGAFGLYWQAEEPYITLSEQLQGHDLALIALHEVIHFLHHQEELKDSSSCREFKQKQRKALIRLIRENPEFWAWWLASVNPNHQVQRLAA